MKWITYQIVCNENENVLLTKRVGYSEANLAIAKKEAYSGKYTIEEDGIEEYSKEPLAIELGGTGANTVEGARDNLGLDIYKTASGEVIVVTDSDEQKPLGLAIDGKSEQKQYSGKNLLNLNHIPSKTENGVTLTPIFDENGLLKYIELNGTASADVYFFLPVLDVLDKEATFNVYGYPSDSSINGFGIMAQCSKDDDTKQSYFAHQGISIPSGYKKIQLVIYVKNGQTVKNLHFYPMVILATVTDDTYEPFVGGKPSPSTEYEQKIRNIGVYDEASGKYAVEVKCSGKNLVRILIGLNKEQAIDLKAGNPITVGIYSTNGASQINIMVRFEDGTTSHQGFMLTNNPNNQWCSKTFTFDKNVSSIAIYNTSNDVDRTVEKLIACYGTETITDDTYEPYKETTATVYLDEPLRKGDKAYWNGDKMLVERNRAVEVFDGSDDERLVIQEDTLWYSQKELNTIPKDFSFLCDSYRNANVYDNVGNNAYINSSKWAVFYDSRFASASELRTWLQSNPVEFEYQLAEPITEEIDIDLGELSMFYPTTILSNDCNANMEVEYVADTKLKEDVSKFLKSNIPNDILRQSDVVNDFLSESEKLPLSAKKGKEIKEDLTAQDGVPFKFGVNDKGEYGYIITDSEGADSVIPFKKGHAFKLTGVSGKGYTNYETPNECLLEVCSYGATYYDTKNYKTVYSEHYGNPREVIPTTFEITGGTIEELEYSETNMSGCVHEYEGKTYIALIAKALYKVTPTEDSMTISFFPVIGEVGMATIIEKVPL